MQNLEKYSNFCVFITKKKQNLRFFLQKIIVIEKCPLVKILSNFPQKSSFDFVRKIAKIWAKIANFD